MHKLRLIVTLAVLTLLPVAAAEGLQDQAISTVDPQKLWALVIGVSNYAHAEPLRYAASDAQSFGDFVLSKRGGEIPADHIFTLLEDHATYAGVTATLDRIGDLVKPGDTVYIYIAGHGYTTKRNIGYFIPSDGDVANAAPTSVPFSYLKELIESGLAQARVRILVTDICNSGRIGPETSEKGKQIQNIINQDFLALNPQGGTFLNLLATGEREASWERDDLQQGVFTYTLLEALNGKAVDPGEAIVAARRAVDYVVNEVPKYTANQQHPKVNQNFDEKLPLAFLDRPGPVARRTGPLTTLAILNIDRSPYSRVEWVDPMTQSKKNQKFPKSASVEIRSMTPGNLEMRFFDADNKDRVVPLKLAPGTNRLDLLTMNISRVTERNAVVQTASLTPIVAGPPMQGPSADNDAALIIRADQQTGLYVDGAFWGNGDAIERYVTLSGLTPGTHNVTIIPNPDREHRFRLKLFKGSQILDIASGEVQYLAEVEPVPGRIPIPPGVPAAAQDIYRRFTQALFDERLIEPAGLSAWDYYAQLRDAVPAALRETLRYRLVVAMGNRAQRTILKYVRGGDIRWSAVTFEEGAVLLDRVRQLFKTTPEFESKQSFFNGRALAERGQYAEAVQQLQRSISLDPNASHAQNAIGLAFWKQSLFSQAIPPLQQAIALNPEWNYPRITLALTYLEQRRYDESEQTFQAALQNNAEDSTAHHGLGQLYLLLSRLDEAEQPLQRAIEFNPGNAYAHDTYGKVYQRRGRLDDAERMFRLAIRLEPDEPAFRVSLAELLRERGRVGDAQAIFAQVANQAASNRLVLQAYTNFLADQKKASEARKLFDQAIKKQPNDANVRVLYGGLLRKLGKDKEAEKLYKAAIGIASANVYAHQDLANLYLSQKKTADAERELALAVQADPRFGPSPKLLGQIRLAQKRYGEALAEFQKALQVTFERTQQAELRELIASTETVVGRNKAADTVSGTTFWKEQLLLESMWTSGRKDAAVSEFAKLLDGLSAVDRRLVTSTTFNLRNDDAGIHEMVYRWAKRFIELKKYREAIALMDTSLRQWIYAIVPNVSPLTIDSLMWPSDAADPKTFNDFEVAHHPDRRAHEIYALAYAGLGDAASSQKYREALRGLR